MSTNSSIEWTDATWNPTTGCSLVSPGCTNCYAMRMAARLEAMGQERYAGTTKKVKTGKGKLLPVWTGKMNLVEDALTKPLTWKKPRRIFVNSMSDLFHDGVPFEFIDKVFAVMALSPQHVFQILTKRPARMAEYLDQKTTGKRAIGLAARAILDPEDLRLIAAHEKAEAISGSIEYPLPNVWLGTSCENQQTADERIPELRKCPAAVRFLSCEPLLGPIEFSDVSRRADGVSQLRKKALTGIHWVIVGGESGPGARPMHPDWARSIRDQCLAAGVPFFFKQWGEFQPLSTVDGRQELPFGKYILPTKDIAGFGFIRKGKTAAGRTLDGRTWDEFPKVAGSEVPA